MGKKPKSTRKRNSTRTSRILMRKEKHRDRSKTVDVNGENVIKPQWKDKDGKELDISNKNNHLS